MKTSIQYVSMIRIAFTLVLAVTLLVGCKPKIESDPENEAVTLLPPDPMILMVIGEPDIGAKISREWAAERTGEITLIEMTTDQWIADDFKLVENVDVVVYPPLLIAELAERELIQSISRDQWKSSAINKAGILSHYSRPIIRYDNKVYGLPLGNPCFTLMYDSSEAVLGNDRSKFPTTWKQLERELKRLEVSDSLRAPNESAVKIDVPLAEGWASWTFLARVAPDVKIRGAASIIFNHSNGEPLIATEPFVLALEQLKRIATKRSVNQTPEDVFRLIVSKQAAIGIGFPSSSYAVDQDEERVNEDLAFTQLPGTEQVFDQRTTGWKDRFRSEQANVDLFGFSGLMVSVTEQSRYPNTALQLVEWMADKDVGVATVSQSMQAGPFRKSHLGDVSNWAGNQMTLDQADEYSMVLENFHSASMIMVFPRIPASTQYLNSLDEGVRRYFTSDVSAQETLNQVAEEWNAITARISVPKQRQSLKKDAGF